MSKVLLFNLQGEKREKVLFLLIRLGIACRELSPGEQGNTIGALTNNVITFFIISMVGNALNFALNLLGCYVHDMRLQCLEFFGRFYEDGGKPFRPVSIQSRYVDVVKE